VSDNGVADIQDFSLPPQRNQFKIDGEVFEAAAQLPAGQAMGFIHLAEQWSSSEPEKAQELFRGLFSKVLLPESYERFVARLNDLEHPVTIQQLQQVISWLFERYGMGPTEESSDSSTGSGNPNGGTPPPDGSPSTASTSTVSPSTVP